MLLNRAGPTRINEVWVADITYIPLKETGFGYLALLMDLFSRRIVGWSFLEEMGERLVLGTLREAIRDRQPGPGLIHHSDRGGGHRREAVVARAVRFEASCAGPACDKA